MVKLHLL